MIAIKPENTWFNQIALGGDEEIVLSYPSNHTQGKRAVGGKLFVTNQRIAFAPNRIDAQLGGRALEIELAQVTSVTTEPPRISLVEIFSGALRTRLAIHSGRAEVDFFVVTNPKVTANAIATAINPKKQNKAEMATTRKPSD